jgi:hypothetical protein
MSTAAWTSTVSAAASSAVISGAALVASAAAVSTTAMVASSVPSGVSPVAGFCDSGRSCEMGQDGVTDIKMDNHWTAHGNH